MGSEVPLCPRATPRGVVPISLRTWSPFGVSRTSEAVDNLLGDAVSYCSHGEGNVRVRVLQPQPVQLELPY